MNILIKNCNLISMDENRDRIENNIDILIKDNKIERIEKNIPESKEYKVIDATNKFVLPGFINTHAHLGMSIFRESVDGYTTQDWLTKKIWPIESKLTDEDVFYSTLLSCAELIKTGTTTVNDHYFFADSVTKAVLTSRIRAELTSVVMDNNGDLEEKFFELEKLIKEMHNKYDTIYISVGIHSLYTSSKFCVERAIKLAKQYNLNVHMHYLENSFEADDISNNYNGEKSAKIIEKYFSETNNIFAHCVKLTDEDFKVFKDSHINVAHCPISNLKLGCGIADLIKMQNNGIVVSLGTDGQGSGCNLDMFETMKFAGLLQKGINEDPTVLPAYDILKMATINGAKALNKDSLIGSISENKLADLIILDMSDILMQPINDVFSDIVYNAKGTNVETTIINGAVVMENRKLTNINEKDVIDRCSNILKKYE